MFWGAPSPAPPSHVHLFTRGGRRMHAFTRPIQDKWKITGIHVETFSVKLNHGIRVSKLINVSIPFRCRVSIPIDVDVPNWPVSVQYFSHVEMDMLFLLACHWLVVGATCGCFPDGANEHLPWLPLKPRVRISCAPTAMFMHHLSLEHGPFLKYGALPKDRGKGKCPAHKALWRAESSTHHTRTKTSEWIV